MTYGELFINNGVASDSTPRIGPAVELPVLGSGAVVAIDPDGPDVWLEAATDFLPRWRGAWVELYDASGESLGSYRADELSFDGRLRLESVGSVGTAASFAGEYRFDATTVLNEASLVVPDAFRSGHLNVKQGEVRLPPNVTVDHLTIQSGASVVAAESALFLDVAGTLTIENSGLLDATGQGYVGATGTAVEGGRPDWVDGPTRDYGGSHGGYGAHQNYNGQRGDVYGSVYVPLLGGGGGAYRYHQGGSGGGVLSLSVGNLVVDGTIRASAFEQGGPLKGGAAGAGGSILITATHVTGSGLIDASGGELRSCSYWSGAGGGGRVALYSDTLTTFDPETQITTQGGAVADCNGNTWSDRYAGAGTVYLKTAAMTYGELFINNGLTTSETPRLGPDVELPELGTGDVTLVEVAGPDAWITANSDPWPRWVGAWMELFDLDGTSLGGFRVSRVEAGELLLDGAASAVDATSYRGEYRFDATTVLNGAVLVLPDQFRAMNFEVKSGEVRLPAEVVVGSMTIRDGGQVVGATERLDVEVAGTLRIDDGGLLDVTGVGYLGSLATSVPAGTPDSVLGPTRDYGGSHGGNGAFQNYNVQMGETYDSVYLPHLAGGGGAFRYHEGGAGGGVLNVVATDLVVDGTLRSSAWIEGGVGHGGAAGAGGTIFISAATLGGTGLIDASGGDLRACSVWSGAGGGGRVAVYVDDLTTFDPGTQLRAWGGSVGYCNGDSWSNRYAGAGTAYVETGPPPGDLWVGQRGHVASGATPLPPVGQNIVGTATVDSEDPTAFWLTASDPAFRFGLGVEGAWLRIVGVDYQILAQSPDRLSVLIANGAAVLPGDSFSGLYRFGTVTVSGGAVLVIDDLSEIDSATVDADSDLQQNGNL